MSDQQSMQQQEAGAWKVSREIPAPWLITIAGALAFQAVMTWRSQQDQAEKLTEIVSELRAVGKVLNQNEVKSALFEAQLADVTRRLNTLETRAVAQGVKP